MFIVWLVKSMNGGISARLDGCIDILFKIDNDSIE